MESLNSDGTFDTKRNSSDNKKESYKDIEIDANKKRKKYGVNFDSWEKNQEFTIYEYVLFTDLQSHAGLRIDGLLDALASVEIENDIIFELPVFTQIL